MSNGIGQATNKLGQLFVDIGVGGLGQTLKALNSVSATFLLTKNAASQAIKPFIDMGKEAANSAVGIGKMAAALGTTSINAQKLQYYLKTYKAEGLEGDVASLQQMFTRIQQGLGGIDGQKAISMNMLGLDWQKYGGSFEDTLKFIQDVKDALKTSGMTENEKVMHLQNLGLSNWKYLFEKEDFDIGQTLNISDEQIRKLQEASEKTNQLTNNLDQLKKNVEGRLYDNIASKVLDNAIVLTGTDEEKRNSLLKRYRNYSVNSLFSIPYMLSNPFGAFFKNSFKPSSLEAINDVTLSNEGVEAAALPSLPNIDNKTTINLTNNISGSNVQFEELSATEENALTGGKKIEINAYTTHNNTGL